MSKRNKKQPYRNALLKTKKERSQLDALFKENQRLKENLLYKRKEAQTLLEGAAKEKETAEKFLDEAKKELRNVNPYHPHFMREINIGEVYDLKYALTYRMTSPRMSWDENTNKGIIKFICYNQNSAKYETIGFGFSEAIFNNSNLLNHKEFCEAFSKEITEQLLEIANKKMKEWYRDDTKGSYHRGAA